MIGNSISCLIAFLTFYSSNSRSIQIFRNVFNSRNMKKLILILMFVQEAICKLTF